MSDASLSELLVEGAHGCLAGIPPEVGRSARLHVLDALGVGVLGARRGPLRGLGDRLPVAAGAASILGSRRRTSPAMAALVNGAAIHSLEYDDTHVASVMHGSSTLLPAALAAAEQHGASGSEMLAAYAVGWEVLVRFGLAAPGRFQAAGFQTTSAAGPFAAALVSTLLDGDVATGVAALGVAGIQPGGTFAFLENGDTVKAVQPGWAAHAGLVAADLARAGVGGPRRVLDGDYGFFDLFARDPGAVRRMREQVSTLGSVWTLPEAAYKLLPCCHFIHPFVEALQELMAAGLTAADVGSVRCHVPDGVVAVIADPWPARQLPASPHDARWSLPYVLAGVLVDGTVDLSLFEEPIGGDRADLAARMERVVWRDSGYPERFPARIEVTTTDGRTLHAEVRDVRGGAARPIGEDVVLAKARGTLTLAGVSARRAETLVVEVLESADPDLDLVTGCLAGTTG